MKYFTGILILTMVVCSCNSDQYVKHQSSLFPVHVDGKWGFIDRTGKLVIIPQYDNLYRLKGMCFNEGLAPVESRGKWGYIDETGKYVIEPQFDDAGHFSEGFACIGIEIDRYFGKVKEMKFGYINKKGEQICELMFDDAFIFSSGYARVRIEEHYTYIDRSGQMIMLPKLDWACDFSEGLAWVHIGSKCGFIDKSTELVIQLPCTYESGGSPTFNEGVTAYKSEGKWGYLDKTGKWVIPPQFTRAGIFSEGLAFVELNNKLGFIDKTGEWVIEFQVSFIAVSSFSDGFARFVDDSSGVPIYGYLNKLGTFAIAPQFDYAQDFCEGLALVGIGTKFGYIDKTGRWIYEQDQK